MKFVVCVHKIKVYPDPQNEDDFIYRFRFEVFSDDAPECAIAFEDENRRWYSLNACNDRRDDVINCVRQIYPNVQNLDWQIREDGWKTYILDGDLPSFFHESDEEKEALKVIEHYQKHRWEILNRGLNQVYESNNE